MALVWNTKRLVESSAGRKVEYHLLSGRRLRDGALISADPDHSSAGEWVVREGLYSVSVLTRPNYILPQILCLSFTCFNKTEESSFYSSSGPPVDEVAFDFAVLLSLFARYPITLLGIRRLDDHPVIRDYHYDFPRPPEPVQRLPDCAVNTVELNEIIEGVGKLQDGDCADVAFAAMRLYYSAIGSAHFDPSGAYASLIVALETLAAYHFRARSFSFAELTKFDGIRPILGQLRSLAGAPELVDEIEHKLAKSESAIARKLRMFVADFLPDEFWNSPDTLWQEALPYDQIPKSELDKRLNAVYRARSGRAHAGSPFPAHTAFGVSYWIPRKVATAVLDHDSDRTVPSFRWFERMTNMVITEYLRRFFAPSATASRSHRGEEQARLLEALGTLETGARGSLKTLVEWTIQFADSSVVAPMAPNSDWADCPASVETLQILGIIATSGDAMSGKSWLKNRDVGNAVGEFFYGPTRNPLFNSNILPPTDIDEAKVEPPPAPPASAEGPP